MSNALLTPHDVRRLSVEAQCAPDTIERLLRGDHVRPSIEARIRGAAARLCVALPAPEERVFLMIER